MNAHRPKPVLPGLPAQPNDISVGGIRRQQRMVDQPGDAFLRGNPIGAGPARRLRCASVAGRSATSTTARLDGAGRTSITAKPSRSGLGDIPRQPDDLLPRHRSNQLFRGSCFILSYLANPCLRLRSRPPTQPVGVVRGDAHAAKSYWDAIRRRFSALSSEGAPPSVKTALLSLAYNRGAGNPGLEPLAGPLDSAQWDQAAQIIGSMQQDHKLTGIRTRRQQEGRLIEAELEFLASA